MLLQRLHAIKDLFLFYPRFIRFAFHAALVWRCGIDGRMYRRADALEEWRAGVMATPLKYELEKLEAEYEDIHLKAFGRRKSVYD